jgi:hypothetical protein
MSRYKVVAAMPFARYVLASYMSSESLLCAGCASLSTHGQRSSLRNIVMRFGSQYMVNGGAVPIPRFSISVTIWSKISAAG